MFSGRLVACATMFLVLFPGSGSAEPDFNGLEIDVDWQLASLPLPPDLEPITTSAMLDIVSPSRALKDRSAYLPAIAEEAAASGVPPALVDAVVRIESRYDPTAVGSIGEIGLMQVRPKTAALLGFQGTSAELAEPRTNLRYGVGYLAKAWRLADGDLCRALMKYRAGHGSDKMSALSIEYCRRARQHLAAVGIEIGTSTVELAQPVIRTRGNIQRERSAKRTISAIQSFSSPCERADPPQSTLRGCKSQQSMEQETSSWRTGTSENSPLPACAPDIISNDPMETGNAEGSGCFALAQRQSRRSAWHTAPD